MDIYDAIYEKESEVAMLEQYDNDMLGAQPVGSFVDIADYRCKVVDHAFGRTTVITSECANYSAFGFSSDYETSLLRDYLNTSVLEQLRNHIGDENILEHCVHLEALSGGDKDRVVRDKVSVVTFDTFREFSDIIGSTGVWHWTATPLKAQSEGSTGSSRVVVVKGDGSISHYSCDDTAGGVYPFFVLKSSLKLPDFAY